MRVIHVVESAEGGVARHLHDLSGGLADLGVDQTVLYAPGREDWIFREFRRALADKVTFIPVQMQRPIGTHDLGDALALRRTLRQMHTGRAVLHAHSSKAGALVRTMAPWGTGRRIVYTPHAFITMAPTLGPVPRAMFGLIERLLALRTAAVVTVSPQEAAHALELGFPVSLVQLIPHGIRQQSAEERKAGRQFRADLNLSPEAKVLSFVGRFVSQKAPDIALQAFLRVAGEVPDVHLVLAGDGELLPSLRTAASRSKHANRIHFPGRIEGRIVFAGSDAAVLPSRYESFGYVYLEALTAGIPVVATDTGIASAVAAQTSRFSVVPPDDPLSLAAAIRKLDYSPDHAGATSLTMLDAFSVAQMVSSTFALYQRILAD